ncbi:MAG TPA: hypothetical protein VHV29_16165 [Terriglobales bacterium]|jgi:hypothetical protein|nr:hypothetical protein [Terriglobales bacterium]
MDIESHLNPEQEARETQPGPNAERASAGLSEDAALALLNRADVTAETLAQLAKNPILSKSRKVLVAIATHPRTPRHVSIPLLRSMFTFDLMNTALMPAVAPDIKRVAEEQLIMRLESLPVGQKITLARRASGRVAAALLQTSEKRITSPALDNKQLTEALVVQALMKPRAPELLFVMVSDHSAWQLRREIQIALLRSQKTPLDRAQNFAKNFSADFLQEILPESRRTT